MVSDSLHSSSIRIRPLKTIDELKAVEQLQLEVWNCSEREVLPSLALIPLMEIGGGVLGAFDREELIGFVVSFPGIESGKPVLHSDMLAVKAAYRSSGLGYKLKLAQREAALASGIDTITWTFDPLQSTNAHLNFTKLGVIARKYKVNYYGQTSSPLHRTGTDRLWVTWNLNSERVKQRVAESNVGQPPRFIDAPVIVGLDENDEPVLETLVVDSDKIKIEIPHDINAVSSIDQARARRWRDVTRAAFTSALSADFVVAEFFRRNSVEGAAGSYLLMRPFADT